MDDIKPSNIVTLASQIQSFVAMFMNEPHSHPRYYGELLKAYGSRLFIDNHKPAPYYASGVARLTVDRWFNSRRLDRRLRPYRHHMLMLLRMQIGGSETPKFNHHKITMYALNIVDTLRDPDHGFQECEKAVGLIEQTLADFDSSGSNTPDRLREFTKRLMPSVQSERPPHPARRPESTPELGADESGSIGSYDDWKNFGFIDRDAGGSIFVHTGELTRIPWHLRQVGTRVTYRVVQGTERRPMAGNVTLEENQ